MEGVLKNIKRQGGRSFTKTKKMCKKITPPPREKIPEIRNARKLNRTNTF